MRDLLEPPAPSQDNTPLDLAAPGVAKALAERITKDIDDYCAVTYDGGHRTHLGASLIGHECARHSWYVFRWARREKFSGRMSRLFNRGHREEERFIEWLRGIGFQVWDLDPAGNQFRIAAVHGHFGGSLDGVNKAPMRYRIDEPMLCEFKTSGTGAGFTKLKEKGVAVAKPRHFAQMSSYGKFYGFRYALYICINKNDDDIYVEIVKLDWNLGEQLVRKAEEIILSKTPPTKLAQSEAYFVCKNCNFAGVCHRNEPLEKNCRSCVFARPVENAAWFCEHHGAVIPADFIKQGCAAYRPIQ